MKSIFCNKIRKYRNKLGLSQEALAEKLGVSPQAISKWECAQSYPDVELLPEIAKIFRINIDDLFSEETKTVKTNNFNLPIDGVLRIVQIKDGKILSEDEYDEDVKIKIDFAQFKYAENINMKIMGNAEINGNINGNVTAKYNITCEKIEGNAKAEQAINCGGSIVGYADAGQTISCGGHIGGYADAGNNISCKGSIGGNADAGNNIIVENGNIEGEADAGNQIQCGNIGGDVAAGQIIKCGDITGETIRISCGKELDYKSINGNVIIEKNKI